jgi:NadR type nicotinamide-nucleotide adenylyltransferase
MTLGKFAPLHRGHRHVIETAMAETDHVIVVIYDAPEVTHCPLPLRAGWIKELYPRVEVILAWDGPQEVSDDPAITRRHDEYLQRLLAGKGITHFYSSEFYGDHVSRALGAVDRRVDPNREAFPISGTELRADPFRHRQYLDPIVYCDLITKVVLLGAPSTGKSTLAEYLAVQHNTVWVPEYGREYWETHQVNRRLTPEQLVELAEGHLQREEALTLDANRYLFIDTDATTTYQFSLDYHGTVHPRLAALADACRQRYDLFFLSGTDIPYDDTWDRSGQVHRDRFQAQIEADLRARETPFVPLRGSVEKRCQQVNRILSAFDKFDSSSGCRRHPRRKDPYHVLR